MGKMKEFAENVSVDLGYGGKINDRVLDHAQQRLKMSYISSLIKKYRKEEEEKLDDNKPRDKQD